MSQSDFLTNAKRRLESAYDTYSQRFLEPWEKLALAQTEALIAIAEALIEVDDDHRDPCPCFDEPVAIRECDDLDCECHDDESYPVPDSGGPNLGSINLVPHITGAVTRILFLHPREWV